MQEYLEREYLMFNFSFYRFVFHTIKPPKTCPVRKKQFENLVQLHRKSNNIIRNRTDTTLDCKTGLHWIAPKSTPFLSAKISARSIFSCALTVNLIAYVVKVFATRWKPTRLFNLFVRQWESFACFMVWILPL